VGSQEGEQTEFRGPDEQSKIKAWSAFMAEWDRIKQATRGQGDLVGQIEDHLLVLTDYSPTFA
jgi:hypothetical protein